jgi:hypothetical protein
VEFSLAIGCSLGTFQNLIALQMANNQQEKFTSKEILFLKDITKTLKQQKQSWMIKVG